MNKLIAASLILVSPLLLAKEVTVIKGDTLSEITQAQLGAPVYGKTGNLNKLLKANTKITDPDLIYIDQKIQIPFADEIKTQLAARLKNKLTGNLAPKKKSRWDFGLDAKLFTSTLGIQSTKRAQTETSNSGLSYGATGSAYFETTENSQVKLELGVKKIKYGDRNIKINQNASALSSARLGGEYLWNNKILLGLYGGLSERLVATNLGLESLELKRQAIGQVGLGTAFILSESGKSKVALGLSGNYLFELSGKEYGAKIDIIRSRTTVSPFLNYTELNTKVGRQDDLATGLNLSYQL